MMKLTVIRLLPLSGVVLIFLGCGGETPEEKESIIPPGSVSIGNAPPPPVPAQPVPNPNLPATGQITTSATSPPPPAPPQQLTPAQQQIVVNRMMNQMARAQAEGLGNGNLEVNGAWTYSGYSYLSPNPDSPLPARLVAVDVTIEGHRTEFDIDDVEIVDGLTHVSYGSDPHVTFLAGDARPLPADAPIPVAPEPTRALLIYAFPKSTPRFTLYYWGKDLLKEPMGFADSGWGLPYPDESN